MNNDTPQNIAIIGAGPAGLMAAEKLSALGLSVTLYERKASVGRKFLMAGRGGLNLTHSEDMDSFISRYGDRTSELDEILREFPPQALKEWCEALGQETFIGTSGRIFPKSFKSSPLLRAWIGRLEAQNVAFKPNHNWLGWDDKGALRFDSPEGITCVEACATLLALGGASWPRLGSDGSWVSLLEERGVKAAPLEPSNCGFSVRWSDLFRERFAGQPLKSTISSINDLSSPSEIMITDNGIEGGAIYALSSAIRKQINQGGSAQINLDLKPALSLEEIEKQLRKPRSKSSLSTHLRKHLNLSPISINFLIECSGAENIRAASPKDLAALIKKCPLTLDSAFPIERAISSAGGVEFKSVDENLMLQALPGVFVAGEMLDWEAPTGGYLLQACFATGVRVARGIAAYIAQ